MIYRRGFFLSFCFLVSVFAAPFFGGSRLLAAERVALLIGNSEYASPGMALLNPVNDVTALGAALRGLDFQVIEAANKDSAAMEQALDQFGSAAQGADIALFFYAGHGVQIGGANHLIGTDFSGSDLEALRRNSMTLDRVRDVIAKAGPNAGILLIDACRNNPFTDKGLVEQGLIRARGGAGLLIAYATDPGNVAYDGTGQNSIFTASLLEHIATPDLDIRLMLGRVRQQVVLDTNGRQVPWVEESLLGEYEFAQQTAEAAPQDETSADLAFWRSIAASNRVEDFEKYLQAYPAGLFAPFVRDRIRFLSGNPSANVAPAGKTLSGADPQKLSAALAVLGLLQETRTRDLGPALDGYRRQVPVTEVATAERLYKDAAQVSVFLAATTLQKLRTDIVALRSLERTLTIAEDALAQIEEIARTNPAAVPILQQAQSDVYDIFRSRGVILRRLDQSRSYYDGLLNQAVLFFPPDIGPSIVSGGGQLQGLEHAGRQIDEDAALFLRHVEQADDSKKGSYQWLADLITPG